MTTPPPAEIGAPLEAVDTPALILELDAFERNLERMRTHLAGSGVAVRPHAKSHKCAVIALQQVSHGAVGVCCQKVGEAEAMVHGGVRDVFVSNEIVARSKLVRLAALARQARIAVAADDAENVASLEEVAADFGVTLDVLVEVKVMPLRCGLEPGEAVVRLARQIADRPHLRFAGLHAYHGTAQHLASWQERRQAVQEAVDKLARTREVLDKADLECRTITGGGTGTYRYDAASGIYNEVQPGSYIFMDVDYGRIGGEDGETFTEFEHSLFVWTQVMGGNSADHAVVDAGTKAMTTEKGMPWVHGRKDVEYTRASDEHGELVVSGAGLRRGDRLLLIPPHCDPTVNLHDWYVGVRRNRVEALWPITARGAIR